MNADDADVHDENWRVSNPCACDFDFLFYGVHTGMLCLMLLVSMFHHRRNIVLHKGCQHGQWNTCL